MKPFIHSSVHSFIQDTCAEAVPGAGEWTKVTGLTVGMKTWAPREPTNMARCNWEDFTEEVKSDLS